MSVPAERRRYERHTIKLPGRLKTQAGQQSACVVRDYCSGGLLVQQLPDEGGGPPIRWESGQTAQLQTDLLTPKGPRRVRIEGVVAWANDDFFGLSFARTSNAIVDALGDHDRLARSDTPVGLGATPGGEARYIAKLRQVANAALPGVRVHLVTHHADPSITPAYDPTGPVVYAVPGSAVVGERTAAAVAAAAATPPAPPATPAAPAPTPSP